MVQREKCRIHAGQRDQFAQQLLSFSHAMPTRNERKAYGWRIPLSSAVLAFTEKLRH
jgi:hypothetical protein